MKPHFQMYDLQEVPGAEYAAFALPFDGNWMNSNENGMDPVHAVFLHRRYSGDFDETFAVMPEHLTWQLTGDGEGMMYMMIRRVDDEWLWARSLHKIFPNQRSTPSVFELDRPVYAKRAYYIRIGVPVDDDSCIWFGWRVHGRDFEGGDPSLNGWRTCCMGGQSGKETYEASQRAPGDLEAQGSQCTDRGQGLQVFGDMGNSFDCAISHVELRDLAACEDHLPYSVLSGWHQSDRVSGECLGQFEDLALEADAAFVLDAADLMFGRVLDGRQGLGEGTRTGSEPGSRHVQVEGLVGPLAVVDDAPAVEGPLAVPEIACRLNRSMQHKR